AGGVGERHGGVVGVGVPAHLLRIGQVQDRIRRDEPTQDRVVLPGSQMRQPRRVLNPPPPATATPASDTTPKAPLPTSRPPPRNASTRPARHRPTRPTRA